MVFCGGFEYHNISNNNIVNKKYGKWIKLDLFDIFLEVFQDMY